MGYVRVSTSGQDDLLQRRALIEAGVEERDIFADVISGARAAAGRPGMARLLEYAVSGDTIVVWRIDRLGRSVIDVLTTVKTLQERCVAVRSLTDGIDPSTSSGKMVLGVLATLAEYERDLIRERVNAGIAAARAREHPPRFGRPPLDPGLVAEKLAIAGHAREAGKTAAQAASLGSGHLHPWDGNRGECRAHCS